MRTFAMPMLPPPRLAATAIAVLLAAGALVASTPVAAEPATGPVRVRDTRGSSPLAAGATLTIDLRAAGLPSGTTAVEVNLTVDRPAGAGHLTAFPCGITAPDVSNLNFAAGETISNSAMVALGADDDVCVVASADAHVVVDVLRGFGPDVDPFVLLDPVRVLDSREASPVPAGTVTEITVAGRHGVPVDATAVVLQLTAPRSARGFVTAYACGQRPPTSSLNTSDERDTTNRATTDISADGTVCVYNSTATHLLVDVNGAYAPGGTLTLRTVDPVRIRNERGPAYSPTFQPPGQIHRVVALSLVGEIPADSRTARGAVVFNITVEGAARPGYVIAWPCDIDVPGTSSGNFVAGRATATAVTVNFEAGTGNVCIHTSEEARVIIDLQAYYAVIT